MFMTPPRESDGKKNPGERAPTGAFVDCRKARVPSLLALCLESSTHRFAVIQTYVLGAGVDDSGVAAHGELFG
jgi:hypothetical protein